MYPVILATLCILAGIQYRGRDTISRPVCQDRRTHGMQLATTCENTNSTKLNTKRNSLYELEVYQCKSKAIQEQLLRQTIKRYAGPQYAPLLTRISFEVRSPQLEGQIFTKTIKQITNTCRQILGMTFSQEKKPLRDAPQRIQELLQFI